jgi:hypothetical protein
MSKRILVILCKPLDIAPPAPTKQTRAHGVAEVKNKVVRKCESRIFFKRQKHGSEIL